MGLIECTSNASLWRGYDYYEKKKVKDLQRIDDAHYSAFVEGTAEEPYRVHIELDHPRRSTCNCPHADGKRIVCKHIMAVYFSAFPEEAKRIYDEAVAYQEEQEKLQEEMTDIVCRYVEKMKKSDLQDALLHLLFTGPEWQYERFIDEYDLYDNH